MKELLRVLMIEDSAREAEAIRRVLEGSGYEVVAERTADPDELRTMLCRDSAWNLILAEQNLPGFSGLDAHEMIRSLGISTPFLLVTRPIGEEVAARAIDQGVGGCIGKDHLPFLAPVVDRILREERRRVRQELAEEALRVQEARYEHLFREAPVGLFRLDLTQLRRWMEDRGLTTVEGLEAHLRSDPDALRDTARRAIVVEGNEKAHELVRPMRRVEGSLDRYMQPELERFWHDLLRGLVSEEPTRVTGELTVAREEDAPMHLLLSTTVPARGKELSHLLVAALDVTAQWQLQARLEEVQRMESVGRLAGGVAHDFNNALTVIQTYASFVRSAIGEENPVRDDVDVILESARSAARLTEQLLAYGRRQVQQLERVSLNESITNIIGMLRRIIGEDIRIEAETEWDLWLTDADRAQLQQVLMNLAVNARDAMGSGGTLTFSTRNVRVLRGTPDQPDIRPGEYVRLDVSDTGIGMEEETASHAFDPFFTTKPQGSGTGLGLSTVYGIVKQSGGHIQIRSEPGVGTTFEILLPRSGGASDPAETAREHPADRGDRSGTEHLLLVEDDDALRVASRRILEGRGYSVEAAPSAEEGLALWEADGACFDGVVTDVILPGIDGLEMARRIRELRPGAPILFMSGYSYDQYAGVTELSGAVGFVRKPFTVDELLVSLRATLDKGIGGG